MTCNGGGCEQRCAEGATCKKACLGGRCRG
jgi:hypothetical protein